MRLQVQIDEASSQDNPTLKSAMPDVAWIDEELSSELRMLKEAMRQQKTFGGGQPFDRRYAALDPPNVQRFNTFFRAHQRAARVMARAMEVWVSQLWCTLGM